MSHGFVITGTDTGIGKTIVAAGLTSALSGHYWKPIQAGLDGETDSEVVARLSGVDGYRIIPEAYRLAAACAPHEAARLEDITINSSYLQRPEVDGTLLIEGAGGVMVPINDRELMIDLFALWDLPIIVVARTALGTINHSLLTVSALRTRCFNVAGMIFVGAANSVSERAIIDRTGARDLGRLPYLELLNAETLTDAIRRTIKLEHLT